MLGSITSGSKQCKGSVLLAKIILGDLLTSLSQPISQTTMDTGRLWCWLLLPCSAKEITKHSPWRRRSHAAASHL